MVDTALRRDFKLGEEKYIDFRITSHKKQVVVVSEATYSLLCGKQIVATGSCEVDGEYISVLLKPPETGSYLLQIRYTVPPESRNVEVVIRVS